MNEIIKNINKIITSKSYIEYNNYHSGNLLGIIKVSRLERVHSDFIAWLLKPTSSHNLKFFPIYQFVRLLFILKEKNDNKNARIDNKLEIEFYDETFIIDAEIKREFKNIDILLEIKTKLGILPIIVENKVESKENGKNNDQTIVYSKLCDKYFADSEKYLKPVYVFLFPEYKKEIKQKDDKYIRMTYQELVDNVIEPSMYKCTNIDSKKNIEIYLQSLSYNTDYEKGGQIMAISNQERKILNDFILNNKQFLLSVLSQLEEDGYNATNAFKCVENIIKDYSSYRYNGKEFRKGKLVLEIVRDYIDKNSEITFDELKKTFDIKINFDKKDLIRKENEISKKEFDDKRVFVDHKISLSDGNNVYINNQISNDDMPKLLEIFEKLGYDISKA